MPLERVRNGGCEGTFALAGRFLAMSDLNRASLEDITATGIEAHIARQLMFWGPFRAWEDLLWLSDVDDETLERLKARGFELRTGFDHDWAPPKRFELSQAVARR